MSSFRTCEKNVETKFNEKCNCKQ